VIVTKLSEQFLFSLSFFRGSNCRLCVPHASICRGDSAVNIMIARNDIGSFWWAPTGLTKLRYPFNCGLVFLWRAMICDVASNHYCIWRTEVGALSCCITDQKRAVRTVRVHHSRAEGVIEMNIRDVQ
jgi:hypothetical protein